MRGSPNSKQKIVSQLGEDLTTNYLNQTPSEQAYYKVMADHLATDKQIPLRVNQQPSEQFHRLQQYIKAHTNMAKTQNVFQIRQIQDQIISENQSDRIEGYGGRDEDQVDHLEIHFGQMVEE